MVYLIPESYWEKNDFIKNIDVDVDVAFTIFSLSYIRHAGRKYGGARLHELSINTGRDKVGVPRKNSPKISYRH